MITVVFMKQGSPDDVGLIPSFLDDNDPRPAAEQFDAKYGFGGGWSPLPGFKRNGDTLSYPGDPPMKPLAMIVFRNELIFIYPFAWVMIMQPGGAFEVARMD